MERPTLTSARLILRPFTLDDAERVTDLAGDKRVAATTTHIPHPYILKDAIDWISTHKLAYEKTGQLTLAVVLADDNLLIGAVGIIPGRGDDRAEIGYWIAVPYWNNGYCTEAARAIIEYGFEELRLNRIQARHFGNNPASGRVMQKCGMTFEGTLRQFFKKWGEYLDTDIYSILKDEYYNNG